MSKESKLIDFIASIHNLYNMPFDKSVGIFWMQDLHKYDLKDLLKAFAEHRRTSQYPPRSYDLISIIERENLSGIFNLVVNWRSIDNKQDTLEQRRAQNIVRLMSRDGIYHEFNNMSAKQAYNTLKQYYDESVKVKAEDLDPIRIEIEEKKEVLPKKELASELENILESL